MQINIGDAKVVNTRYFKGQNTVWRRRKTASGTVFTTRERIDLTGKIVTKAKKRPTESYQPVKLLQSLVNTLAHRDDALEAAWALLTTIENRILEALGSAHKTIGSKMIAKVVLATLKDFDTDAFIIYARYHPRLVSKEDLREILK